MSPGLKNPATTEITLGITQNIGRQMAFHFNGFRRHERNLISLVNEGVPFSSYTQIQVPDPGPDGTMGTADDSQLVAYNQDRETLGKDRYVLVNPSGHNGFSEGLEMKLTFSSKSFEIMAAMTRFRAVAATAPGISARENDTSALLGAFDDPNKSILAKGSTYFDRGTLGRLWATFRLPWNLSGSLVMSYQDGLPYSRYLPVLGLNQGVIAILTTQRGPGMRGSQTGPMTSHYNNSDLRLVRDFIGGPGKFSAVPLTSRYVLCIVPTD